MQEKKMIALYHQGIGMADVKQKKEGIYANWLALERHCNAWIPFESPLYGGTYL